VESPEYIKQNNLEIDYVYYLIHQVLNPCVQILEHLTDKPEKLFENCIIQETNRLKGKRPLAYYFKLVQDIENAKNNKDGLDDEDDDEEEEVDDETKTFLGQFATDFENDTNYEQKNVVCRAGNKKVVKKEPAKKVPVKKPAVKKKGIGSTKKCVNNDGGFSL
jgi:hypothetical protein